MTKLTKCLKCELNFINDGTELCSECEKSTIHYRSGVTGIDFTVLRRGIIYGTSAISIYDECCKTLSWDKSERGKFLRQQLLYARLVDEKRERDVWFLAHSNLTGTQNGNWKNTIKGDVIQEDYFNGISPNAYHKADRITFVKNTAGMYEFLGVYSIESETKNKRIYKLLSKDFPTTLISKIYR